MAQGMMKLVLRIMDKTLPIAIPKMIPSNTANLGDDDSLYKKLVADVLFCGPHGFSDANLKRSLRNRYKHDVHQADGSAQQGDQADEWWRPAQRC